MLTGLFGRSRVAGVDGAPGGWAALIAEIDRVVVHKIRFFGRDLQNHTRSRCDCNRCTRWTAGQLVIESTALESRAMLCCLVYGVPSRLQFQALNQCGLLSNPLHNYPCCGVWSELWSELSTAPTRQPTSETTRWFMPMRKHNPFVPD